MELERVCQEDLREKKSEREWKEEREKTQTEENGKDDGTWENREMRHLTACSTKRHDGSQWGTNDGKQLGAAEKTQVKCKNHQTSEVHCVEGFCIGARESKKMRRYKGFFVFFLGIEHRMRRAEMEEQFKKESRLLLLLLLPSTSSFLHPALSPTIVHL